MTEAKQCQRDEVGEAVDDGLDLLPPPFSGIAKVARKIVSAIIGSERRKRRARIKRQKLWAQAAGENAKASSDATTRAEAERRAWGTEPSSGEE